MKKRILSLVFAVCMAVSLTACGGSSDTSGSSATEESTVLNLVGEWEQTHDDSDESYQIATITEDTITIYWYTIEDETKALYWAGTYVPPEDDTEPYTWDSENDYDQTSSALLASDSETKTFTYEDGELSYEVTALGVTTTISLEQTSTEAATATNSSEEADTEDAAEDESSSADDGVLGSYVVEITGAELCEDYEGNQAILVSYSWTNNSEDTTSAMATMMEEAFQDGVQLDTAIVDFEYEDSMTDVRPGTTIDIECIYTLTSDSVVEFEVYAIEDMFKDDVPMVTAEFDPAELESR